MQSIKNPPLNDLQLSILRLIHAGIDDKDLLEIKKLITGYLASKASDEADKMWLLNKWDNDRVENILNDPDQ